MAKYTVFSDGSLVSGHEWKSGAVHHADDIEEAVKCAELRQYVAAAEASQCGDTHFEKVRTLRRRIEDALRKGSDYHVFLVAGILATKGVMKLD